MSVLTMILFWAYVAFAWGFVVGFMVSTTIRDRRSDALCRSPGTSPHPIRPGRSGVKERLTP